MFEVLESVVFLIDLFMQFSDRLVVFKQTVISLALHAIDVVLVSHQGALIATGLIFQILDDDFLLLYLFLLICKVKTKLSIALAKLVQLVQIRTLITDSVLVGLHSLVLDLLVKPTWTLLEQLIFISLTDLISL